jgi:hypothetical protein
MFPPIFCVPVDEGVAVFGATQIRPRVYTVAPYRILHGGNGTAMPEEAYAMDGRFGGHPSHISNDPLTLISYHPEFGSLVFEGSWVHCGTTVFSMYCGSAIPMLEFNSFVNDETTATGIREERGLPPDWFRLSYDNHLPVIEGTRRHLRTWSQRWNPMSWIRPEDDEGGSSGSGSFREADASGPGFASPRGGSPVASQPTRPAPLPKHVADLLIRDAETRGTTCPITMEPIKAASATATPCGHVFNDNALNIWRSTHSTCPECRASL